MPIFSEHLRITPELGFGNRSQLAMVVEDILPWAISGRQRVVAPPRPDRKTDRRSRQNDNSDP